MNSAAITRMTAFTRTKSSSQLPTAESLQDTAFRDLLNTAFTSGSASSPKTKGRQEETARQPERGGQANAGKAAGETAQAGDAEKTQQPEQRPRKSEEPVAEQMAMAAAMAMPVTPVEIPVIAAQQSESVAEMAIVVDIPTVQPVLAEAAAWGQAPEVAAQTAGQATATQQAPVQKAFPAQEVPQGIETQGAEKVEIIVQQAGNQPTEAEKPQSMQPAQVEPKPVQEKFDRMVQKAAQELEQVRFTQQKPAAEAAKPAAEAALTKTEQAVEEPKPAAAKAMVETGEPAKTAGEPKQAKEERKESLSILSAEAERPVAQNIPVTGARQAEAPKSANAPDPAEQVQVRLVENLENQKMEFRMQLQPEELGKVNVRMVLESGRLAVEITAESAKAAQALQRQAEGLAESLRIHGVELERIQIVTETQSSSGYMENAFNMNAFADGRQQPGQAGDGYASEKTGGSGAAEADAKQPAQETPGVPQQLLNYAI